MIKRRSRLQVAAVGYAVLATTQAFAFGVATHTTVHGDTVEGRKADESVAWTYRTRSAPVLVDPRPDGSFLINGTDRLSSQGRLIARYTASRAAISDHVIPFSVPTETWTNPIDILPGGSLFLPPIFDPQGNAWTIVADAEFNTFVYKSTGLSGAWAQIGGPYSQNFDDGSAATDGNGNIMWAAYALDPTTGTDTVAILSYSPSTGLSSVSTLPPSTVSGGTIGQNSVNIKMDATGDAVVFNTLGYVYWVYTAATQSWSGPTAFPTPTLSGSGVNSFTNIALVSSPDRTHIDLAYTAVSQQVGVGIYFNSFDTATKTFGTAVLVPRTNQLNYGRYAGLIYQLNNPPLPAFVDNDGTFTAVWSRVPSSFGFALTLGSRYQNGKWKTQSLYNLDTGYDLFCSTAIDNKGDILVSELNSPAANEEGLLIFKYDAAKGWSTDEPYTWTSNTYTRERIAWLGEDGKIAQVFMQLGVYNTDYQALSYLIYDGSNWSSTAPVPPANNISLLQEVGVDAVGDVALLFNPTPASGTGVFTTGIWSTSISP